jgi:hypothetical protein
LQYTGITIATYTTFQSTFATFIRNTCNIPLKHLKHTLATCDFQCNISLLLGRMEARWLVKFIGIELAGSAEIAAPVEKAT